MIKYGYFSKRGCLDIKCYNVLFILIKSEFKLCYFYKIIL